MSKQIIYLITDRYEHAEFYAIYGNYNDEKAARKDWPKQLKIFKEHGPDDCHCFRLTKHELTSTQVKELFDHINKYEANEYYAYNEVFTEYMDNLMNSNQTEELKYSDGL